MFQGQPYVNQIIPESVVAVLRGPCCSSRSLRRDREEQRQLRTLGKYNYVIMFSTSEICFPEKVCECLGLVRYQCPKNSDTFLAILPL